MSPLHDVMPVGFFLPFVGLAVLPAAAGSHAELCDAYTAWGEIGLGIPAEMPKHNYFVHTSSHTNLLFSVVLMGRFSNLKRGHQEPFQPWPQLLELSIG